MEDKTAVFEEVNMALLLIQREFRLLDESREKLAPDELDDIFARIGELMGLLIGISQNLKAVYEFYLSPTFNGRGINAS